MSREIKYRAWHKRKKMYISHGELFAMDCSNEFPFLALIKGFYKDDDMDIILEQYIGRQDKNGLEIYEGDIVRLSKSTYPCLVYWDGIGFYWLMNGRKRDIDLTISKMNIIGNINENKELLK